jgi:hypothetical protein
MTRGVIGSTADSGSVGLGSSPGGSAEFDSPTDCHGDCPADRQAPFGYGLVFCPFKAAERVRVPHGVPVSGSSVGRERRSDTAEAGGSIPPRTTRRSMVSWRPWCSGNTAVCGTAVDGFNSLRSPQSPCSTMDSAPVSGTGGCRFESCQGHSGNLPNLCSSTDRAPVYEAVDGSSILSRGTSRLPVDDAVRLARVAQRTERRSPKPDWCGFESRRGHRRMCTSAGSTGGRCGTLIT